MAGSLRKDLLQAELSGGPASFGHHGLPLHLLHLFLFSFPLWLSSAELHVSGLQIDFTCQHSCNIL